MRHFLFSSAEALRKEEPSIARREPPEPHVQECISEGKSYSSRCPGLDAASQGETIKAAVSNPKEAVKLHLECLSDDELKKIRSKEGARFVTTMRVPLPA